MIINASCTETFVDHVQVVIYLWLGLLLLTDREVRRI